MNGSHISGASVGAIVGTILVALGHRIGLTLSDVDASTLGIAAVGVGIGLGHAIGRYGIIGIFRNTLHGLPQPLDPPPPPPPVPPA